MAAQKLETGIRRDQIAEAVLQVIQAHGFKGLSMENIALRVGLVPSAIYRHFKNKGEVLDAALDLIHDRLMNIVSEARAAENTPVKRLKSLLRRHVMLAQHFQAIPRILFSDHVYFGNPGRKAKMHGIFHAYLEAVAGIIREGQADGSLRRDTPPETLAAMFLGLFQPAALLWHMSDGGFDMLKHIDHAWRVFQEGACPAVPRGASTPRQSGG